MYVLLEYIDKVLNSHQLSSPEIISVFRGSCSCLTNPEIHEISLYLLVLKQIAIFIIRIVVCEQNAIIL